MTNSKIAVIGIGAIGTVLSAALLKNNPDTVCIGTRNKVGESLISEGLRVAGALDYKVPVRHFLTRIEDLNEFKPNLIFIATKTYHLTRVLKDLELILTPETKIVSTHNGLGTEDVIAEKFGPEVAFRMSLNFGASLKAPGNVEMAFFNRPNHLGSVDPVNKELGQKIAGLFNDGGLDTEFVDDIKLYVWKKMIYKCSMASICAVTDQTIKGVLDFPPTREIAIGCFNEALAVSKAMGYDLGDNFLNDAFSYLEKVGSHKDSMCYDIANKLPTEIDFLGQKVVDYGLAKGIQTPFFVTMTNLVKAMENNYLNSYKIGT